MIIRINVTEEVLKLIPIILIDTEGDDKVFVDRSHLYIGSHLLEDMAMALGVYDRRIASTEDDAEGYAFPDEDTQKMLDLHGYITKNLFYLESLIHQYVVKGGLEVGVYKAKDNELIWEKEQ